MPLRPEDEARCGGPAWFDTALADRMVGGLYPLYRESGPFAAQLLLQAPPGRGLTMAPLRFAYNTNGAANHRLDDAVALIADAGYDGVALTLDHHHLDPMEEGWVRARRGAGARPAQRGASAA